MEYLQLLDQTIELLKPVAPAGGQVLTKLAANALWDWIKTKVKGRSAAVTEAVEEVEKAPADPVNWDTLRLQLRKALTQDETLRAELAALVAKYAPPPSVVQSSAVAGHANVVIQTTGTGNIDVQR
jgi:hypothetical protein